ncbi:MAG: dTDP-4-dehydrorhamnose 3,5-epimerase [Spirochaetia bacterium]|jgi:dTDP-4-dehydrorhamnose 3,5-epimerase|nr:dTDP-4-dehydrorhamnose 3,5-epimerase [Spirochaetia bacterium]
MPFIFEKTLLKGLIIIQPRVFEDERGFFMETYKKSDFVGSGITEEFTQDNHSYSSKGVLRGIHFQTGAHAQGKLVQVITGAVWDVAVDLRVDSISFGQWYGIELTEENMSMLYIPPGFGHGFVTLKDNTHFLYKCTKEYNPKADSGIIWNDADLGIDWPLKKDLSFSEKDLALQTFRVYKELLA